MPSLTFFTAKLNYQSVVADSAVDPDFDPQVKGFFATAEIRPFIKNSDGIDVTEVQAATLSPAVSMLVLAPIRARIDSGQLMLRADPDLDIDHFPDIDDFPEEGEADQLYRDLANDKVYKWNGTAYVQTDDFAPVRLVAQTAVLGLPVGATLNYRVDFSNVKFNEDDQELPSFGFQAPTSDVVLDLATVARITL